jgi:hypothetical protein
MGPAKRRGGGVGLHKQRRGHLDPREERIRGARVTHGYHGVNRQILRNHLDTQGGCQNVGVVLADVLTMEGTHAGEVGSTCGKRVEGRLGFWVRVHRGSCADEMWCHGRDKELVSNNSIEGPWPFQETRPAMQPWVGR